MDGIKIIFAIKTTNWASKIVDVESSIMETKIKGTLALRVYKTPKFVPIIHCYLKEEETDSGQKSELRWKTYF